jgi:hypothetical protein
VDFKPCSGIEDSTEGYVEGRSSTQLPCFIHTSYARVSFVHSLPPFPQYHTLFRHCTLNLIRHALQLLLRLLQPTHSLLLRHVSLPRQTRFPAAEIPVVEVPVPLDDLRAEVDGVAAEEEVVCGGDGEGVAHKGAGVEG